jgi:hypothetical protein
MTPRVAKIDQAQARLDTKSSFWEWFGVVAGLLDRRDIVDLMCLYTMVGL